LAVDTYEEYLVQKVEE